VPKKNEKWKWESLITWTGVQRFGFLSVALGLGTESFLSHASPGASPLSSHLKNVPHRRRPLFIQFIHYQFRFLFEFQGMEMLNHLNPTENVSLQFHLNLTSILPGGGNWLDGRWAPAFQIFIPALRSSTLTQKRKIKLQERDIGARGRVNDFKALISNCFEFKWIPLSAGSWRKSELKPVPSISPIVCPSLKASPLPLTFA